MTRSWILAVAVFGISNAHADVIPPIKNAVCIPVSAMTAHKSIVDYAKYSKRTGSTLWIAKYAAVKMISPSSVAHSPDIATFYNNDSGVDARVSVALSPLMLDDRKDLWPRFTLRCTSFMAADKKSFQHQCNLETELEHFGLRNFKSVLTVNEDSRCGSGSVLKYQVNMESESTDVDEIREAMGAAVDKKGDALLKIGIPFVLAAFKDRAFFNMYYEGFYKGWIDTVSNGRE